jgi:hypothetical protein
VRGQWRYLYRATDSDGEKVTASAGCWNVLVVTRSAAEEVAEFVVLSAKSVGRLMLLETAHTSDASFDPAMVSFKSIVQVDARL